MYGASGHCHTKFLRKAAGNAAGDNLKGLRNFHAAGARRLLELEGARHAVGSPSMQHLTARIVALMVFAIALVAPRAARAEAPIALPMDVSRVIESSYAWFEARTSKSSPTTTAPLRSIARADKIAQEPSTTILNPPIRLALVARDWGSTYTITGRKIATDDVRLSRSQRMLVGRARMDLGKFQPFVHVGLGEWRYDPTIMTLLPSNQEYATQLAAGFEMRIAKYARLAFEADYTLLVREEREAQNHPEPRVLGAFAVMHAKF